MLEKLKEMLENLSFQSRCGKKLLLLSLLPLFSSRNHAAAQNSASLLKSENQCLSHQISNRFERQNEMLFKRISFSQIDEFQNSKQIVMPKDLKPIASYENGEIQIFELPGVASFTPQIVSFRGSVNEKDWLTNSEFLLSSAQANGLNHFGFVHTGFLKRTKKLLPWLMQNIQKGSHKPVYFTGHSLGGALATMAAAELVYLSKAAFPILGVYSFGAPKLGDEVYTNAVYSTLKQKIYRSLSKNDPVPLLPPAGDFLSELELNGFKKLLTETKFVKEVVYESLVRPHLNSYAHSKTGYVHLQSQSTGIAPLACATLIPESIADLVSKYGLDFAKILSETPASLQSDCLAAHGLAGYFTKAEIKLEMCN